MTLSHPAAVLKRLDEIEGDLADRQNTLEEVAFQHFKLKRDKERQRAWEFLNAHGTVAERSATADHQTALIGVEAEAKYEALRAVVRVLETRASIAQSILKTQGRQ